MFYLQTLELYSEKDDQDNVVEFDFLGKDSIRYTNNVPVEKRVSLFTIFSIYLDIVSVYYWYTIQHNFTYIFCFKVYKNLELFKQNKQPGDDLFDRLTVSGRRTCIYFHFFQIASITFSIYLLLFKRFSTTEIFSLNHIGRFWCITVLMQWCASLI